MFGFPLNPFPQPQRRRFPSQDFGFGFPSQDFGFGPYPSQYRTPYYNAYPYGPQLSSPRDADTLRREFDRERESQNLLDLRERQTQQQQQQQQQKHRHLQQRRPQHPRYYEEEESNSDQEQDGQGKTPDPRRETKIQFNSKPEDEQEKAHESQIQPDPHFEETATESIPDPQIAASLEQLVVLRRRLESLVSSFRIPDPASLTFSNTNTKKMDLPFQGEANKALLAFDDSLSKLLVEFDKVDSFGSLSVRKERKELVNRTEAKLEELESVKRKAWDMWQNKSHEREPEVSNRLTEDAANNADDTDKQQVEKPEEELHDVPLETPSEATEESTTAKESSNVHIALSGSNGLSEDNTSDNPSSPQSKMAIY